MQILNLPVYSFTMRESGKRTEIFDKFRKRFVVLTPEEWVRQNLLRFLTENRSYPETLIAVEKSIAVNGMQRRYDAVVFDKNAKPLILIECKAATVEINQQVFDQVFAYNLNLGVPYYIISNGLTHVCVKKYPEGKFEFLQDIPYYNDITV